MGKSKERSGAGKISGRILQAEIIERDTGKEKRVERQRRRKGKSLPFLYLVIFREEFFNLICDDIHKPDTCFYACPCDVRCDQQPVAVF